MFDKCERKIESLDPDSLASTKVISRGKSCKKRLSPVPVWQGELGFVATEDNF